MYAGDDRSLASVSRGSDALRHPVSRVAVDHEVPARDHADAAHASARDVDAQLEPHGQGRAHQGDLGDALAVDVVLAEELDRLVVLLPVIPVAGGELAGAVA